MDTSAFAALFGPPPSNSIPVDWEAVQAWLGLTLPGDYTAIASTYGPLDVGERIWLHTPCAQRDRFDYGAWLLETHRHCRIVSREAPPFEPPTFHPEPGGLLAWGTTRHAEYLFWDTAASENPDRWPVVLFQHDAVHQGVNPWQHYRLPLLDMLAATVHTGLPLPVGGTIGPLPAVAERTAFLGTAARWTPPAPAPDATADPRRRTALTDGTGLAALTTLVPPPTTPHPGGGTWPHLFQRLGTALPTEYVHLIDRYGAGCWKHWLRFPAPLHADGAGLVHHAEAILDGYRHLRAEFPEDYPLPVWPEPGGFLPFAGSIDGDELGWLTEGEPDTWPLVVVPRHADQGPPLQHGLIDTMLAWARGQFSADGFARLDADDDPLDFAVFEPWDSHAEH